MKRDNFIGTRFGQLTVISPFESDLNGHSRWVCKCDCGLGGYLMVTRHDFVDGEGEWL